jgi:hypothetical protein
MQSVASLIAESIEDMAVFVDDMRDLGADDKTIIDLVFANLQVDRAEKTESSAPFISDMVGVLGEMLADRSGRNGAWVPVNAELRKPAASVMRETVERLFAEAPKLTNTDGSPQDGQAPAMECMVMMRSGAVISGVMSVTKDGALRMLTQGTRNSNGSRQVPILVEQFFDFSDVMMVAVERQVTASPLSTLIT